MSALVTMKAQARFDAYKIRQAVKNATYRSLPQAAASLRLWAKYSIKPAPKRVYAMAGTPPHTHKNRRLKNAIVYDVQQDAMGRGTAVIGPSADYVGNVGKAHEQPGSSGSMFRGRRYPKRAFMAPALNAVKSRLPAFWSASVR